MIELPGRAPALLCIPLVLLCGANRAAAQIVNPATAQQPPKDAAQVDETASEEATTPRQPQDPGAWQRLRSWELLPVTVVQGRAGEELLFEEDLVGTYRQPRWTAKRLFPTTRIYVVPEGKVEFEHWTRVKTPREGQTTVETQYELEFGLPNRFQLDLYFVTEKTGSDQELDVAEQKFEIRHALADWGEIPLNPTLYAEWVERSEKADKLELKLLIGDQLAPTWHWGANLVYEHEVGGALESEYGITAGISHTLIDSKLALGAELKASLIDDHFDRGDYTEELEVGPSVRWQPLPALHVDFAPLFGIGPDSRQSDICLVLGWEF